MYVCNITGERFNISDDEKHSIHCQGVVLSPIILHGFPYAIDLGGTSVCWERADYKHPDYINEFIMRKVYAAAS